MSNDKMENTASKKKLLSTIGTVFFAVVSLFYVAPIVVVFVNSLKKKAFINLNIFSFPDAKSFAGGAKLYAGYRQVRIFKISRLDSIYYSIFSACNSYMHLNVCLVFNES